MTKSVNSHKNRKYKPLLKNCVAELLVFFKELEVLLDPKEFWRLYQLSPAIEKFGDSVLKVMNKGDAEIEANYCVTEQKFKQMWKGNLTIPPYKFVIERPQIKLIYKTLKILKELKLNDEIKENNHFMFIGEHREISSNVLTELDSFSTEHFKESMAGTSLPSVFFKESSAKAIETGRHQINTEEGANIYSEMKFSYVVIPVTSFAESMIQAYKVRLANLDTPIFINDQKKKFKYTIPSVFSGKSESLFQIICSIFIEYYISFGGIDAIKTCDVCDSLFLEKKKDSALYCSDKFRRIIWSENNKEKEEKSKCRNRQKVWFTRNTKHLELPQYKEFCLDCPIEEYLSGGECPFLYNIYREDVADFKKYKEAEKEAYKKDIGLESDNVQTDSGLSKDIKNIVQGDSILDLLRR